MTEARLACLWIDDDREHIQFAVQAGPFARHIDVHVAAGIDEGLEELNAGFEPDLLLLDVQALGGSSNPGEAAATPLASKPWVLISDLGRRERLDKQDVVTLSSHFIRIVEELPETAARILRNIRDSLADPYVAPSRDFLAHLLHEARRSVERARWELRAQTVINDQVRTQRSVAELDAHLQAINTALDLIGLQ